MLACCAGAHGQDVGAEAREFLATPEYNHNAMSALEPQVPRLIPANCRAGLHGSGMLRSPDLHFAADGRPDKGWIRVSYDTDGCGSPRTFNVWVVARASGAPRFVAGVPGSSKADLALQADATRWFRTAVVAAPFTPSGCKDIRLLDTRFDAFTGNAADAARMAARPWHETWHAYACGHTGDIDMRFSPDATGTTIAATPKA